MVVILSLAGRKNAGNIRHLLEVDPQAAHRVMHARENLHRHFTRIVADKLFVNFKNAFELAIQRFLVDVRQVEINHRLSINAQPMLVHHLVNGTRRDIARYQVAVLRIPLFEEIPAVRRRNTVRRPWIVQLLRHPHAATLATRRLAH